MAVREHLQHDLARICRLCSAPEEGPPNALPPWLSWDALNGADLAFCATLPDLRLALHLRQSSRVRQAVLRRTPRECSQTYTGLAQVLVVQDLVSYQPGCCAGTLPARATFRQGASGCHSSDSSHECPVGCRDPGQRTRSISPAPEAAPLSAVLCQDGPQPAGRWPGTGRQSREPSRQAWRHLPDQ